eukprot:11217147-Lingulodinium_polyedra.AAC.1
MFWNTTSKEKANLGEQNGCLNGALESSRVFHSTAPCFKRMSTTKSFTLGGLHPGCQKQTTNARTTL